MDLMEAVVSERETGSRSRDLLLRFSGGFSPDEASETGDADSDDIELGLSLGGCFNLSNSHKNRIVRTSSIPAILPPPLFPLSRACSLPEEESWMRKEMQCKKRMEVKRKREERRSFRRAEEVEDGPAVKLKRSEVEIEGSWTPAGCSMIGAFSPAVSSWTAGAPPPAKGAAASEAQGSVFSPGSSSSGGSELESRPEQGFEISGLSHASLIRSTSISTAGQNNNKSSPILNPISNDTFSRKSSNGSNDLHQRMVEEMPAVSTKGDGHNGRKIDGFLYRYGRGEEVRIVCVCHGSFHTPAEFVKHGGGGNVEHPLRHIVVNPSPASFS